MGEMWSRISESLAVDAPIRIKMATMDHSLDGSFYGDALYDYSG